MGALVWLAYLVGADQNAKAVRSAVESTLAKPAVAGTVGFVILLLGGWCVRNLRFEWLAWWPGQIEVAEFQDPATAPGTDVAWLTSVFRERVTQLSLQAPASVPGAAAEGTYLDVLSDASLDARNPLSLLRLGHAIWPTRAYRVEATLQVQTHRTNRLHSVLAQVTRLPNGSSTLVRGEGASWEEAVRQAADEATALILPRTRLCQRQWLSWRGYVMPTGLLPAYERAVESEAEGAEKQALERYDEAQRIYDNALLRYDEALSKDPFNLAIRLRVGQLHEKTDRPMEALAAYQGIVTVTRPAGASLPRSLYRQRVRRERRRVITIARYRRAVLLGGDRIANAWANIDDSAADLKENLGRLIFEETHARAGKLVWEPERSGPGPAKRRLDAPSFASGVTLDELLATLLCPAPPPEPLRTGETPAGAATRLLRYKRLLELLTQTWNTPAGAATRLLRYKRLLELLTQTWNTPAGAAAPVADDMDVVRLRALFAALGFATTRELLYERRLRLLLIADRVFQWLRRSRVPSAPPFTVKTLRLSQLCIQLRLARALYELGIAGSNWHIEGAAVLDRVDQVIGGRVRQWHEGYNAACACGIPLLYNNERSDEEWLGANAERLALMAINWLERATACADSAFVAGEDEWLNRDPDLRGVRGRPGYRTWRSVYFPKSLSPARDG